MNSKRLATKVRLHAINMAHRGKSSHVASALSIADIVSVLYATVLKKDPANPRCEMRDRFILSKGHAAMAVYAALAEIGYFPVMELARYYMNGSTLVGHISHTGVPGVEFSTGSLGHGLPVATGMALVANRSLQDHRVFALLSEGDCDEGATWEAALFASHHSLSNLIVIVDYKKQQSLGTVEDTLRLEPLGAKWKAFGWDVVDVDGHDHELLTQRLDVDPSEAVAPTCVIAHTTKGKGVSFMENSVLWHYRSPQGEEYERAISEIMSRSTCTPA